VCDLSDVFWKRWNREFLSSLQQRRKWSVGKRDFKVGDVVLLIEDDSPRNSWPLGVITELDHSEDRHVRKVAVKVHRHGEREPKTYIRPITKLAMLLECDN